jgi:signal peptidase I
MLLGGSCPGLGHLYAGSPWWAVCIPAGSLALAAVVGRLAATQRIGPSAWLILAISIPLLTRGLLPWHAWWIARRRRQAPLLPVQRVWVYLAFWVGVHVLLMHGVRAVRGLLVEPYRVPSASMAPTVLPGDLLLVSKLDADPAQLRSQVVLLDAGKPYIKRVVGLAGDVVEIRRGVLKVDAQPLPREHCSMGDLPGAQHGGATAFIETDTQGRRYLVQWGPPLWSPDLESMPIPAEHMFLLGDNRDNSQDSRQWGPLPTDLVRGTVLGVWASFDPETHEPRWERFGLRIRQGDDPALQCR